jgi:hypothetical protein
MNDDLYCVDKYTDEQLYNILDINNPTDRELEAKILHLIQNYKNIQNESGDKLAQFFENIYDHFFHSEPETIQEGFEDSMTPPTPIKQDTVIKEEKEITAVQSFDYSKDKLQINPLIKQTITRVISIDSQYRNINTSPYTTDFTFDLSEPLRDVVSLKLYSVQIPYTWYTIGKGYGSNFFYLSSIHSDKYNYKIEIAPGSYDQTQLIDAINTSFDTITNTSASEINFNGQKLLSYNTNTSKTTVNLNMQNTFNETYYSFNFPVTSDVSNNLASYMGFNTNTYYPNTIYSNKTYMNTSVFNSANEQIQNYILDNSNNYFTVIQYISEYSDFTGKETILNNFKVQLINATGDPYLGNVSRLDIKNSINNTIQSLSYFDNLSGIEQIDVNGKTYFQLRIVLNRNVVKYVPNSKTVVIFPNEIPKPNQYYDPSNNTIEQFTIWNKSTAKYNGFYFDSSMNIFSKIVSENTYTVSTVIVDLSTNINFICNTPGFEIVNDFSLNIESGVYSLPEFVNEINNTIKNNNTNQIFNINNTTAYLDSQNKFNFSIDMTKNFSNRNYKIVIDPSSVLQISAIDGSNNFTSVFDTSGNPGTIIKGIISNNPGNKGYVTNRTKLFTVVPVGNEGNQLSGNINVLLKPFRDGTRIYPDTSTFFSYINQSILDVSINIININDIQFPFTNSSLTTTINPAFIDVSLNMQCNYYLTESNYSIVFTATDLSFSQTVWGGKLYIDPSYNLYSIKTANSAYATIKGNTTTSSNIINITTENNKFTIITINSNVPQDTIYITLRSKIYTIDTLYDEINYQFNQTPKLYGSNIQKNDVYTQLWLNINNIYTTADYKLVFYNAVSFLSCLSGKSLQNTTWDTTIGWILGFRDYFEYYFTADNVVRDTNFTDITYYLKSTNGLYVYKSTSYANGQLVSVSVNLTGDSTLNTNLFNYFLISLDDYIQNHLNDGLVTITRSQISIETVDYSYSSRLKCDPGTNTTIAGPLKQSNSANITNAQLYSLNQSIISNKSSYQNFSPGPYIKDLFGIVPIKIPSKTGDIYTEFGGTLQNQTRIYFGPVNIRKMSIQLLSDRGNLVDLNGSNWTFSFVCEQLYRSTTAET